MDLNHVRNFFGVAAGAQAAPEPTTFVLLAGAIVLLALVRSKSRL